MQMLLASTRFPYRKIVLNHTRIGAGTTAYVALFGQSPCHDILLSDLNYLDSIKQTSGLGQDGLSELSSNTYLSELSSNTYFSLLVSCVNRRDLENGRVIHAILVETGLASLGFLGNSLVDMYAKCGSMRDAHEVFKCLGDRNVVAWTMMITGCSKVEQADNAFTMLAQMQHEGTLPDIFALVSVIHACASCKALQWGRHIHTSFLYSMEKLDVFIGNSLLDLYTKCGSIREARQVFECLQTRDIVTWSTLILGYSQSAQSSIAIELYERMCSEGHKPNWITFIGVLKACISLGRLLTGRKVHSNIIEHTPCADISLQNTLIDMYIKCRHMNDARKVFDQMVYQDNITWNILIFGYVEHNCDDEALNCFSQMVKSKTQATDVTFMGALRACANMASLLHGMLVHFYAINNSSECDAFVATSLVDMYAKCGTMEDACKLFDKLEKGDIVMWNAMVVGYAQHGHGRHALHFLLQMQLEGVAANETTYASILKVCSGLQDLWLGKCIHALLIKSDLERVLVVQNALLDMYFKCGSVVLAYNVFNSMPICDSVTWNAMIAGYTQHGLLAEAFKTFWDMQRDGIELDEVSFLNIMKSCHVSMSLDYCDHVHSLLSQSGMQGNIFLQNTLVNMYARCGNLEGARQVFDSMEARDRVSWAVIITSYAQYELFEDVMDLFMKLIQDNIKPNKEVLLAVVKACGNLATLEEGRKIYSQCVENGFDLDVDVENNVIDMYAKGGSLEDARSVFDGMPERDISSWIGLILGIAQHGHATQALDLFEQMIIDGIELAGAVFLSVLNACCHAGLLYEGCQLFSTMVSDYDIPPTTEQYTCVIDLFCRLGLLEGAGYVLERMPFQPTHIAWTSLLSACRLHGDLNMAKCVVEHVLELDPDNAGVLVTLGNIIAIEGH